MLQSLNYNSGCDYKIIITSYLPVFKIPLECCPSFPEFVRESKWESFPQVSIAQVIVTLDTVIVSS